MVHVLELQWIHFLRLRVSTHSDHNSARLSSFITDHCHFCSEYIEKSLPFDIIFQHKLKHAYKYKICLKILLQKRFRTHEDGFCAFLITWKYMPPSLKIEFYN